MDRFQEMQIFVRIAERSSFTHAAQDLMIPQATVTNMIKKLEARLGTRLLARTTRTVQLTDDGQQFYQSCLRLLADIEEAESQFRPAMPKGLLRVNMQRTLAQHFIMPAISEFTQRYPDITLHISDSDRLVDMVREGFHCVLRAGNLQDSTLIARRVALMPEATVASPDYLARYGEPKTLAELDGHFAVSYISSVSGQAMPLVFYEQGKPRTVSLPGKIAVDSADLYTGAAEAGMGIVQVPRYRVETALNAGTLREILPQMPPAPMPVSLLYPQKRHVSSRVAVFIEWVSTRMAQIFPHSEKHLSA
ncbi:LysR family transcriptional regulator [Erwinia sp. OLTSP20]|uniref:LysR family transcriptional regulator n=1 Tax=unclassified Erwinia TaxID=2622719 RepID=UPI000C1A635A|nr:MULTISPECIES: LysR family transcriptional regulator [unclassified Erwinia]PIJ50758.1 LysR family transcriptional regulator [Erwinia sp. OAMSP11]PIJ75427.1 LysR family transcriptional regulator [Erwinia sp. OLSSP12]PIJ81925.1 LysR family transcriptional regulator [Erwinia sp. OLCASP19]PIJ84580.1 LysR family transcriptional regulator [Erwinia sp. OLMTSP26]PIJ86927.1 LysR family transcriptional regulator [Erwinia sp. OLMDSP33]